MLRCSGCKEWGHSADDATGLAAILFAEAIGMSLPGILRQNRTILFISCLLNSRNDMWLCSLNILANIVFDPAFRFGFDRDGTIFGGILVDSEACRELMSRPALVFLDYGCSWL